MTKLLHLKTAALAALCASWLGISVSAQTILRYDLTSNTAGDPPESSPATTIAPGLAANDLVRGEGLRTAGLGRGFSADAWNNANEWSDAPTNTIPKDVVDPTRENAIAEDNFFQFSFTVQPGFTASLSTMDHAMRRSAAPAPSFFEWQYSFDGFATPGTTLVPQGEQWDSFGWDQEHFRYLGRATTTGTAEDFNYMTTSTGAQGDGNQMPTFDLTGFVDLQDIPGGTTVTFRLYGWGADRDSRTVAFGREANNEFGGPMLTGTVIPEPSTYALLFGIGVLGIALVVRRRRKG